MASTLEYETTSPFAGQTGAFLSEYLLIKAGGADAGSVWLYSPQTGAMTPATANQVAAAQSGVSGFSTALTACQAIED